MALHLKFTAVATLAAVIVAACQPTPCDQAPPGDQVGAANAMADCLNTLEVTPVAQMPKTGGATYIGFATGSIDTSPTATDSLIGTARLTASFAANSTSVTGKLKNFSSGKGVTITGSLDVNASTPALFGSNILSGNITNSITNPLTYGGQLATFTVPVWGGYSGTSAEGIALVNTQDLSGKTTGVVTLPNFTGSAKMAIVAMQ